MDRTLDVFLIANIATIYFVQVYKSVIEIVPYFTIAQNTRYSIHILRLFNINTFNDILNFTQFRF